MNRGLQEFLGRFVLPLFAGGQVEVSAPILPRQLQAMSREFGQLGELEFLRLRAAELLVPDPDLPRPELGELRLWVALYNLVCFDHPERARIWARATTWNKLASFTRSLCTPAQDQDGPEMLARHLAVSALLRVGIVEYAAPVRDDAGWLSKRPPTNGDAIRWLNQPHASEVEPLLQAVLLASPLTCLLQPKLAPSGWNPLKACSFLQSRSHARAICHAWAGQGDWIRTGAGVFSALLQALGLWPARGPSEDAAPEDVGAVVGALIHLHFLKVLELEARITGALGHRDPAILGFLALPLVLPPLQPVLGSPVAQGAQQPLQRQAARRWDEHLDHLRELVPHAVVENLLASLVPRIVKGI